MVTEEEAPVELENGNTAEEVEAAVVETTKENGPAQKSTEETAEEVSAEAKPVDEPTATDDVEEVKNGTDSNGTYTQMAHTTRSVVNLG